MLVTLHDDNRIRTWNITDGKCICVSLPNTFPTKLVKLQSAFMQQYMLALGTHCDFYLVDFVEMKIIKSYTSGDTIYRGHLCVEAAKAVWVLDSEGSLYFWRLPDGKEVDAAKRYCRAMANAEGPRQVSPMPLVIVPKGAKDVKAVGESSFAVVYEKSVLVLQKIETANEQEVKGIKKTIDSLEGKLRTGGITDKGKTVVFITECLHVYYFSAADFVNPSITSIAPFNITTLEGNIKEPYVFCSFIERLVVAISKAKQVFASWDLSSGEKGKVECVVQKPWKKLAENDKSKIWINNSISKYGPKLNYDHFCVLQDKEKITASLVYSSEDCIPLYIAATSKGNILIYNVFVLSPVLKVPMDRKEPINCLCVKKDKVLAASVTGSLAIIDISPQKLQRADGKDGYKPEVIIAGLIPSGVAEFLPVHNLLTLDTEEVVDGFELIEEIQEEKVENWFCEETIGVIGCDRSVVLVSIHLSNTTHVFKNHDAKPIGLYLNDSTSSLIVLTKDRSAYVYSLTSKVLERRLTTDSIHKLLDLSERLKRHLPKQAPNYKHLYATHSDNAFHLQKGSNHLLDFCNRAESIQINWQRLGTRREPVYQMICNKLLRSRSMRELWIDREAQVTLFNEATNLVHKVSEGLDGEEFACVRAKVGVESAELGREARRVNSEFRGKFKSANESHIVVVNAKEIVQALRKKYRIDTEGRILKEEEKAPDSLTLGLSSQSSCRDKCRLLWPFPMLSLVHCFRVDRDVDKELEEKFAIRPPLFQTWIGVPGFGETFSFAIPETTGTNKLANWKVSPHLNTIQCVTLFSSFASVLKANEQLITPLLGKLLAAVGNLLRTRKEFPYVSFVRLGCFLQGKDLDLWSAARDVVLRPLLKDARPDSFVNMAAQASNLIDSVYGEVVRTEEFRRALDYLIADDVRMNFEFSRLLNNYIGEVELRTIIILCYTFKEHGELAASERTVKRLVFFISLLIWYAALTTSEIASRCNTNEYKQILVNILLALVNNISSFKHYIKDYIRQIFFHLILVYTSSYKSSGSAISLVGLLVFVGSKEWGV